MAASGNLRTSYDCSWGADGTRAGVAEAHRPVLLRLRVETSSEHICSKGRASLDAGPAGPQAADPWAFSGPRPPVAEAAPGVGTGDS